MDEHKIVPSWASFIGDTLDKFNPGPNRRVAAVYWSVPAASLRGLLVQVRTALAEQVAELRALMPQDHEVSETSSQPLVRGSVEFGQVKQEGVRPSLSSGLITTRSRRS